MSLLLSLDLGTNLGWARLMTGLGAAGVGSLIDAGTVELASRKELVEAKRHRWDRRLDLRAERLAAWLDAQEGVSMVVFEDVKFASSQAQAHLWASFRGVVWSWATHHSIKIDCLDTSKLKLWTTGNGAAKKDSMRFYAERRWSDLVLPKHDDNAVDAICLLKWAMQTYDYQ